MIATKYRKYACPVCYFQGVDEKPKFPYGTHEICECCGTQYGLDVQNDSDIIRARKKWLESGAPWFDDVTEPVGWSIEKAQEQLSRPNT